MKLDAMHDEFTFDSSAFGRLRMSVAGDTTPQVCMRVNAAAKTAEILIYDTIGPDWYGDGITFKNVAQQLRELGNVQKITVRINSAGGDVFDGLAIYTALKNHAATIDVEIVALCASIATVISCAGDTITMEESALYMIHLPVAGCYGNAADMRSVASLLDKIEQNAVDIYAARTGLDRAELEKMLAAETWLTAAEAKAKNFVTATVANKTPAPTAAYDLSRFKNLPEPARARLQAGATPAPSPSPKEPTMTKEEQAAADAKLAADKAAAEKLAAEKAAADKAAADAAKTPVAPVVDTAALLAQGAAAERKRISEITALCATANLPQLAQKFVDDPACTPEVVKSSLFTALCANNKAVGDGGGSSAAGDAASDPDKAYKQEYAANAALYAAQGLTEAAYVRSRQIDDGKHVLASKTAAAA